MCSVCTDLILCRKRTQHVDLPDYVGPIIIHVNGWLSWTTVLTARFEVSMAIGLRNRIIYTRKVRMYCHLYGAS